MSEDIFIETFVNKLKHHAIHKAKLHDGVEIAGRGNGDNIDFFLRCATEELGEVASAITRKRYSLAEEECIDLAHTALLIALAIKGVKDNDYHSQE